MKSSDICTSIEGEKISILCRKFYPHNPKKNDSGKLVYPFKISIHGSACVEKAYSDSGQLNRKESHWAKDDLIHGEAVDGYAGKPIRPPIIVNSTGTHKAQKIIIRGGAYAHVEIGMREQLIGSNQN